MALNPHSVIWLEKWRVYLFPSLECYQQCSPALLSSCLTSRRNVFSVDAFSSPRGDAISLWSKYPHRLPLSPVTMTFHKMSFCLCCTAPLSPKEAKFHLLSETFQQCGHVSFMLFGKRSLKRLYKHVTLSTAGGCFSFSSAETGERSWEVLRRCDCFPAFSHQKLDNHVRFARRDERFHPRTSARSLLGALHWEIWNLEKSYTSQLRWKPCVAFSRRTPWCLWTGQCSHASAAWPSCGWVKQVLPQLPAAFRSQSLDPLFISLRNSVLRASNAHEPKSPLLIGHRHLCCICRNEREHVVFAPLMRCQVIYLWITCLEQPPCAVCIFLSSLESCRSVIADATLCHPEFALTSCEPSGRSISILACPRVYWGWEWLIKQVWASTPILLHAKQELSSS